MEDIGIEKLGQEGYVFIIAYFYKKSRGKLKIKEGIVTGNFTL